MLHLRIGSRMRKRKDEQEFDPGNIFPYLGTAFLTEHGEYRVSREGRVCGRESIEGAQVSLIAGIRTEDYAEAKSDLESDLKPAFDRLILRKGVKPEKGLHLAISLTDEEAERCGRNGIVTSVLQEINHRE